jgi:hypothetical protein
MSLVDLVMKRYNVLLNESDKTLLKQSLILLAILGLLLAMSPAFWIGATSKILGMTIVKIFGLISFANILGVIWKFMTSKPAPLPSTPAKPAMKTREVFELFI